MCLANTVPKIASASFQRQVRQIGEVKRSGFSQHSERFIFSEVMSNRTAPQMREGMPTQFPGLILPYLVKWVHF